MSTEENVQLVKNFFAAMGSGNARDLLALAAEDIEWIIRAKAGRWQARTAGTRSWRLCSRASEEVETQYPKPPEFVAQGDRVMVVGVAPGKNKATNRPFKDEWVFDITVRDGKVAQAVQADIDTQALARASFRAAPEDVAKALPDLARGKTIVDVTNAYGVPPEKLEGTALCQGRRAGFRRGGGSSRGFNHLGATVLGQDPAVHGGRRVVFLASDDERRQRPTIGALAKDSGSRRSTSRAFGGRNARPWDDGNSWGRLIVQGPSQVRRTNSDRTARRRTILTDFGLHP